MWLTGPLAPDLKTIAKFRRDDRPANRAVCRSFVVLCPGDRRLGWIEVQSGQQAGTVPTWRPRQQSTWNRLDARIARYLVALDRADREGNDVPDTRARRIGEKIAALRRQMAFLRGMQEREEAADDGHVSPADPDARSMATSSGLRRR